MAKEWAKEFYQSKSWKQTRKYVFEKVDFGLCRRCQSPGEIVHHKIWLTPKNITDPSITLNIDNLETLCRNCHSLEHEGQPSVSEELMFDEFGNLVERNKI